MLTKVPIGVLGQSGRQNMMRLPESRWPMAFGNRDFTKLRAVRGVQVIVATHDRVGSTSRASEARHKHACGTNIVCFIVIRA